MAKASNVTGYAFSDKNPASKKIGGRLFDLLDRRAVRVLITALLLAAALWLIYAVRDTLVLFLFALLFAYLLEPLVRRVQPHVRKSRALAILVVYILLFCGLFLLGFFVGPRVFSEGQRLGAALPSLYERIVNGNIAFTLGERHGWSYATSQRLQRFLAAHQNEIVSLINSSGARVASMLTNIAWIVIIPILAVFFLKDKRDFRIGIQESIADPRRREFVGRLVSDIDQMLAHFVRAQLLLALIAIGIYTSGLSVLRVPYAFVLGAAGGLLEFIPLLGPAIAAIGIIGISFGLNYPHIIWLILFLGAFRVLQDYVISPRLLGGRVELHPLLTLFGILAGAEVAGVIGVYLSVPIIAGIRILFIRWRAYNAAAELATEPPSPVVIAE